MIIACTAVLVESPLPRDAAHRSIGMSLRVRDVGVRVTATIDDRLDAFIDADGAADKRWAAEDQHTSDPTYHDPFGARYVGCPTLPFTVNGICLRARWIVRRRPTPEPSEIAPPFRIIGVLLSPR